MGFGKAFGIGLVVFIALNFVFMILAQVLGGDIGTFFSGLSNMSTLAIALFGSATIIPSFVWLGLVGTLLDSGLGSLYITLIGLGFGLSSDIAVYILLAGFIVAPLVAAILTGKMAGSKGAAFGAWVLIAILCSLLVMVLGIVGGASIDINSIIVYVFSGLIVGIFYSGFAVLVSSEEFY